MIDLIDFYSEFLLIKERQIANVFSDLIFKNIIIGQNRGLNRRLFRKFIINKIYKKSLKMKLNVFASFTIAALISVAQAGPLPQQSASLGDVFAQADSEAQPVKKGILPEEGDDQHGSEVYTRALLAGKNKGGITVTA